MSDPDREIVAPEPPDRDPEGARWPPWMTLAILGGGLVLSFLLTRHGFFFFILPLILPFGLRGLRRRSQKSGGRSGQLRP